jgi:hypothetical protein
LIPFALIVLVSANIGVQSMQADPQLQLSPERLVDGIVDWVNAGIDSFGPLSEGPQQVQIIDGFIDWLNSMLDGSLPPATTQNKPLPST